jgi:putative DNA primase/helicase
LPDEPIQPFRGDRADAERDLCRKIARWVSDNRVTLERHEPDMPGWMFNRQADNWRPLFAIADIAGGDWPGHARAAAERICGGADEETSVRVQLLKDIGELFKKHNTDQLSSEIIAQELAVMEDRPWPEWGRTGKPISAPQVARQLKPFSIIPKVIRIGDKTPRGYRLAWLEDALRRYGGPQTATPQQVNETEAFSDFLNATSDPSVAVQKAAKPKETADCCGVAVRTGGIAGEGGITIDPDPVDDEVMEWTG